MLRRGGQTGGREKEGKEQMGVEEGGDGGGQLSGLREDLLLTTLEAEAVGIVKPAISLSA